MHTIDVPKRFRAPGEAKKNASKKWNSKNALSLKTKRLSKRLFDKAENIILKQRIFQLVHGEFERYRPISPLEPN